MSKICTITLSAAALVLGALIVHFATFSIYDVRSSVPSSASPLTDEEFSTAQAEGRAEFYGAVLDENEYIQQYAFIRCYQDRLTCSVSISELTEYTSEAGLSGHIFDYSIESWSDEGVIKATISDSCGAGVLSADVKARSASFDYVNKEDASGEECPSQSSDGVTQLGQLQATGFLHNLKASIHGFIKNM